MTEHAPDEAYLPLSQHVKALMPVEDCLIYDEARGIFTYAEEVKVTMPVEIDIAVGPDGSVTIGSAPPLYYADTALQPVFHSLTIRIQKTEE